MVKKISKENIFRIGVGINSIFLCAVSLVTCFPVDFITGLVGILGFVSLMYIP